MLWTNEVNRDGSTYLEKFLSTDVELISLKLKNFSLKLCQF